jgi:hypothetical protein
MKLNSLINRQNFFRDANAKMRRAALTADDIKELREVAECLMSPENISGDGEYSAARVRKARLEFKQTLAELDAIEKEQKAGSLSR